MGNYSPFLILTHTRFGFIGLNILTIMSLYATQRQTSLRFHPHGYKKSRYPLPSLSIAHTHFGYLKVGAPSKILEILADCTCVHIKIPSSLAGKLLFYFTVHFELLFPDVYTVFSFSRTEQLYHAQ